MLLNSMSTSCLMAVVLASSLVSNQPEQFSMLLLLKEHVVGLIHYVPARMREMLRGLNSVCLYVHILSSE
jgi:hypothetical protein